MFPSGKRKSVLPQELNKGNKRLSCVVKPPEMQTKKGKVSSLSSFGSISMYIYTYISEYKSEFTSASSPVVLSLEKLLGQTRSSMT